MQAADLNIPKIANRTHRSTKIIPSYISRIISLKNYYKRKTSKYKFTPLFKSVRITYVFLVKFTAFLLKNWKNNQWNTFLSNLSIENNSLWKASRKLTRQTTILPPLINPVTNQMLHNLNDKLELLASHFSTIGAQYDNLIPRTHYYKVNKKVKNSLLNINNAEPIPLSTPTEVNKCIKSLKNKITCGTDELTTIMIKHLPRKAIVFLTKIINGILMTSHFPSAWKTAKIIIVPKPGKNISDINNIRPISLLSTLSKVLEKVILIKLQDFATKNNILIDQQFGFRPGHSTVHQVARIADYITDNFNLNKYTGLLLFDLEKAFDSAWHNGIIYKLLQYNYPLILIKLIKSYLSNRKFYVTHLTYNSSIKTHTSGVPQGSVLGPYLFLILTNDLPKLSLVNTALYADDLALYCSSYRPESIRNHLQKAASSIFKYYKRWRLKVNTDKTEAIIFTKRHASLPAEIIINGNTIPWKNEVRYLGVIMDRRLTFNSHINYLIDKTHKAIRILSPIFNRRSHLTILNKKLIYTSIIRPRLTYACPVWFSVSNSTIKKLQRVQNICCRISLNATRYNRIKDMHYRLHLPYISNYICNNSAKFYANCQAHTNKLITVVGDYDMALLRMRYTRYKHRRIKDRLLLR